MDECLARCVVDFSGRSYLVWRGLQGHAYRRLTKVERGQDDSTAFRFGLAREFFRTGGSLVDLCLAMFNRNEFVYVQ